MYVRIELSSLPFKCVVAQLAIFYVSRIPRAVPAELEHLSLNYTRRLHQIEDTTEKINSSFYNTTRCWIRTCGSSEKTTIVKINQSKRGYYVQ